MCPAQAAKVAALGLKIVSRTSSSISKRSTTKPAANSFAASLPFLMPLNTPVLQRVVERLRMMDVEQVALVEIVAIAIARGQL